MMVFGMIFAAGTGTLVRLYGKINATAYKEILKKHFAPNQISGISTRTMHQSTTPSLSQII